MADIPSMWRIELLHPLVVHFPIALLIVSAISELIALIFFRFRKRNYFQNLSFSLLVLGVAFGWFAVWSGDQAHSIINKVICDPNITHEHEYWSEFAMWLFSGALLIRSAAYLGEIRFKVSLFLCKVQSFLGTLLILGGAGLLGYSAHLGASLVYLQGAGVYHPSAECTEFE